jgi:hypothetical protein
MQEMPFGMQIGQGFSYKRCDGTVLTAYLSCPSTIQSKTAEITVVDSYDTPATNEVAQGQTISDLRLTTGNPDQECGLQEDDKFFNQANGAGYNDKCAVTVLYCYGVSAEMLLTLEQAVAVNDACLSEMWDNNTRCKVVNNMMKRYWNKYPVNAVGSPGSTGADQEAFREIVNMGARSLDELGCNCWYVFTDKEETLRIDIDNLDSTPFAVGSTIRFVGTFATLQLVPSLDCIRPLGSGVILEPLAVVPT